MERWAARCHAAPLAVACTYRLELLLRLSPMSFFAALSVSGCLTSSAEYKELLAAAKDHDGDGFVNVDYDGDDCDDDRADVNPGAEEVCDGVDNDCDGETDEGFDTSWYEDHDEDGYAAAAPITAVST